MWSTNTGGRSTSSNAYCLYASAKYTQGGYGPVYNAPGSTTYSSGYNFKVFDKTCNALYETNAGTGSNGYCNKCSTDGTNALFGGQTLNSLSNPNLPLTDGYTLAMQPDGNFVFKRSDGVPLFSSNTWVGGSNAFSATLQNDGNLVIKKGSVSVWSTGTGRSTTGKYW